MTSRRLFSIAALGFATLALATPAFGTSCVEPRPIEDVIADGAEIVFVGTVARTEDASSEALFHVEEVWSGPELPEWLWVDGSPADDPGPFEMTTVSSSGDRSFEAGVRYLANPHDQVWADGSELERFGSVGDGICSLTEPWRDEFAILRPAEVRPPVSGSEPGATVPMPLLVAGAGVLVLAAASFIAFRSRSQ